MESDVGTIARSKFETDELNSTRINMGFKVEHYLRLASKALNFEHASSFESGASASSATPASRFDEG
jgi:hypothetical protein